MSTNILVPVLVFFPMAGALISYLIGLKNKKIRDIAVVSITVIEFLFTVFTVINASSVITDMAKESGHSITIATLGAVMNFKIMLPEICGMGLHFILDGFRSIYALVAAFMWMMVTLLSPQYFEKYRNRNRFYAFPLLTLGATMGVFLSADFFTTFIFFEIMSLTS